MKPSASTATRTVLLTLAMGLALVLTGCASDGTTYGNTTGAPSVGVYVIQNTTASSTTNGSVLEFSSTASGAATPFSTLTGPTGNSLDFLAADASGNIYTTAQSTAAAAVLEYTVGSTNNAQPIRSIPFNATTQIVAPNGLTADPTGNIAIPEASGSVALFSSTSTGSVAPSFYIPGGGASTLVDATAAAVDTNDNLYLVNAGSGVTDPIVVFGSSAGGSGVPTRSIGGPLTTLTPGSPQGIATDTAGNLYVANVASGVSSILIFDPAASGNTPPLRDITGSNTQLGCVGGIALDSEGYLYVISTPTCGSTASPTVLKFSTTGTGNIAPVSSFTSAAWTNADATLSIAVH